MVQSGMKKGSGAAVLRNSEMRGQSFSPGMCRSRARTTLFYLGLILNREVFRAIFYILEASH